MSDDFRAMVESAYNEAETNSAEPPVAEPADIAAQPAESAPDGVASASDDSQTATGDLPGPGRSRDASGRFAPKAKEAPQVAKQGGETSSPARDAGSGPPATGAPALPEVAAQPPPTVRAPQSWTPAEREHFAKAPAEVQAAVLRREREAAIALQESAPARRLQQEFQQVFAPAEHLMRSRGLQPTQMISQYVQADQMLSHPDQRVKANAAVQLLRNYGMDIQAFAAAWDGAPANESQAQQFNPRDFAAQVEQNVIQRFTQRRQQQQEARLTREIETFAADPKNEFFEDVGAEVLAILQAANQRSSPIALKDAYERAVWANPETRDILSKRQAAETAKAQAASTQQARRAASSVKSSPSTAGATAKRTPQTHREMIEDAYEELERRG